jgi:hypothetical protein
MSPRDSIHLPISIYTTCGVIYMGSTRVTPTTPTMADPEERVSLMTTHSVLPEPLLKRDDGRTIPPLFASARARIDVMSPRDSIHLPHSSDAHDAHHG